MLEEKIEIKELKRKIRLYCGLVTLHFSVKKLAFNYKQKKDAFFLALKCYLRAMKVQLKYLRNRLKFGPDMNTRSIKVARGCLNFIGLSMHGLMELEAKPKIAEFLRDRLVKLQLKENFGIFYRKSNFFFLINV